MKSLVDRGLHVKGEAGVNLGRHLPWDNLKNLLAELDEKAVERSINLAVNVFPLSESQRLLRGRWREGTERRTCSLPYSMATSINLAYSVFLEAARIRDGFVVASCGLYLSIA